MQLIRRDDSKPHVYMRRKELCKESSGEPRIQVHEPQQIQESGGEPSGMKEQSTEKLVEIEKLDLHIKDFSEDEELEIVDGESQASE